MCLKKLPLLPDIPEHDQTPLVKTLLAFIEQLAEQVQQQAEEIARLKDEINILKGKKKRPAFKPSKLDKKPTQKQHPINLLKNGLVLTNEQRLGSYRFMKM
jgi:hypothetical protein